LSSNKTDFLKNCRADLLTAQQRRKEPAYMATGKINRNLLVYLLYFAVFLNGFEAAGYQTSLSSIGSEYALAGTGMGILAAVQLVAGLIAPLVFGPLADIYGKKKMLVIFFALETAACAGLMFSTGYLIFGAGIFFIGLSVSTIQYVAIAALADLFPLSGGRKIGIITGCYSLGAVAAPIICGRYLDSGVSWKLLFVILGAAAAVEVLAVHGADFTPGESTRREERESSPKDKWVLPGLLLLCAVMFVYVGYENGFAFFVNSYIKDDLNSDRSYLGLSLFWLAMIPSRVLCGYISRWNRQTLVIASIGAVIASFAVGLAGSPAIAIGLCLPLGFFCGAIYPSVLTRSFDFAGGKTATATGMITAATGLGGASVTVMTGILSQQFGLRRAVISLAVFLLADIVLALLLMIKKYKSSAAREMGESVK
jgi:FHS family glucose/mannose:H+ symporter-like MFS transporter